MIFGWYKARRRRRVLEGPFPEAWRVEIEAHVAHWSRLTVAERAALGDIVRVLVDEKDWAGCAGFELTDARKAVIAAQAGTLLLGIEHDYYENVDTILVYPAGYRLPTHDEFGAETERPVLGHAQVGGPVVLSWKDVREGGEDARDGRNLVYHEFAHKLDMLDGWVDGTPRLESREALEAWIQVMTHHYEALQSRVRAGRRSFLDPYGATDVAEFFAVVTEAFFEQGPAMKRKMGDLYEVLSAFYGQDPARWY